MKRGQLTWPGILLALIGVSCTNSTDNTEYGSGPAQSDAGQESSQGSDSSQESSVDATTDQSSADQVLGDQQSDGSDAIATQDTSGDVHLDCDAGYTGADCTHCASGYTTAPASANLMVPMIRERMYKRMRRHCMQHDNAPSSLMHGQWQMPNRLHSGLHGCEVQHVRHGVPAVRQRLRDGLHGLQRQDDHMSGCLCGQLQRVMRGGTAAVRQPVRGHMWAMLGQTRDCQATQECMANCDSCSGTCISCPTNQHACGTGCHDDAPDDPAHGCKNTCTDQPCQPPANGSSVCTAGVCDFVCDTADGFHKSGQECVCDTSKKPCSSVCVAANDPTYGCSATSCDACVLPAHATVSNCTGPSGSCGVTCDGVTAMSQALTTRLACARRMG